MSKINTTDWNKVQQLFNIEVSKLFGKNKTIEIIPEHLFDLFDKIKSYGMKYSAKTYSMTVNRLQCTYYADGSSNFGNGTSYYSDVVLINPDAEFELMIEQLKSDEFNATYRGFSFGFGDEISEPGSEIDNNEKLYSRKSICIRNFDIYTGCIIKDGNDVISEFYLNDQEIKKMKLKYSGFSDI